MHFHPNACRDSVLVLDLLIHPLWPGHRIVARLRNEQHDVTGVLILEPGRRGMEVRKIQAVDRVFRRGESLGS